MFFATSDQIVIDQSNGTVVENESVLEVIIPDTGNAT